MGILANENAIGGGNYLISNSLRFQSASSQYLSRTFGTATSTTTWTWSGWVKRGALSSNQRIFSTTASTSQFFLRFNNTDTLLCETASSSVVLNTTQVFRDPSAWYHIVFTWDTTNATASDRVRLYINGTRITAFATINNPALNATSSWNTAVAHYLGGAITTEPFDGYLAEVNFIDGQALTPSSFGETDALTGVWIAKKYTGTYGTNGFYLTFSNGTSTTTLGNDSSGNANNWTLTNFTRSAGVSDCWMYDVPSGNGSPTATQPSSNYTVVNPLNAASTMVAAGGNLNVTSTSSAGYATTLGSIGVTSGKWYWEVTVNSTAAANGAGVAKAGVSLATWLGNDSFGYGYYSSGNYYAASSGSLTATYSSFTTNDIIGVALDLDNGTLRFYKNNVAQGSNTTGLSGEFYPAVPDGSNGSTTNVSLNFGNRSFAYTPPSGFKALCTANLPTPTIAKGNQYMDATLYTGNGATQSITNTGSFSPDLVWLKKRGGGASSQWHMLADTIRGTGATLSSNVTDAEYTGKTSVTAFNSNGFTLGADSTGASYYGWNIASDTYVGWQWDAGSSTVSNTSGTITSQVRANTTAGVSVVTATKTGTPQTVGHGLGVKPAMIIVKNRAATSDWIVAHKSLSMSSEILVLNSTAAKQTVSWGGEPTSTVFYVSNSMLGNNDFVAYCFAEIAGFSKFGSYTGNGSADGPFVFTNMLAKFVMIKRTDTTGNWIIWDTARNTYNVLGEELYPNLSNAAASSTDLDILSNGFKLRSTNAAFNASGGTYIYACFATNPFNYSNGF